MVKLNLNTVNHLTKVNALTQAKKGKWFMQAAVHQMPRPFMLSALSPTAVRRALILDDNDGNRMLLKFAMSLGKITIEEAVTGEDALRIWKPHDFGFIFVDIELPGMNGLEVVRQIRARDKLAAVIMCSSNDEPDKLERAIRAGCDMFLVKPFQFDTLLTLAKVMTPDSIRAMPNVLVIDNRTHTRWEKRHM
jgi:CheY-like chemotaxis protein